MAYRRSASKLSLLAGMLVAIVAGVHFQQYVDFMSEIPTVGVLFLINAAGGAGLAFALLSRERTLRLLASIGSIALAAASLVSVMISLGGSFFGYSEPTLRFPIVVAIVAEAAAILVLLAMIALELRPRSAARVHR
ncbi:MAG: hypothetical protein ACR2OB_11535 [Solirubrobacteraceae bacterium]